MRASESVADVLAARAEGRLLVLATSGTASRPRSVVRTTESWWASFPAYADLTGVRAGSRVWVPGPLTATMNLFAAVHAAVVGAHVVADPAAATHALLTPAALERALGALPPAVRVTVAGDALAPELAERAEAADLGVAHYYGAAELSFVAAGRDADSLRAFPGVDVEVRDGVIWVRSPYLAEGLGPWATVGDLGRLEGGRLTVLGRPGAVTTAGATVRLADVEHALGGRATCFGVRREGVGEVVAAAVPDAATARELRRLAGERLDAAHRPRLWYVVPSPPLTDAGKVDRAALASAAAEGHLLRA